MIVRNILLFLLSIVEFVISLFKRFMSLNWKWKLGIITFLILIIKPLRELFFIVIVETILFIIRVVV